MSELNFEEPFFINQVPKIIILEIKWGHDVVIHMDKPTYYVTITFELFTILRNCYDNFFLFASIENILKLFQYISQCGEMVKHSYQSRNERRVLVHQVHMEFSFSSTQGTKAFFKCA